MIPEQCETEYSEPGPSLMAALKPEREEAP